MQLRAPESVWSNACIFLLPALSLVLPSGYSYAPALIVIVSLISIRTWWGKVSLPSEAWWLYGAFALLALTWLADSWISGERGSALEKPIKILLTLPCLYYLARRPPQGRWLWHGLVIGALGAALLAVYQALGNIDGFLAGWYRPAGFTNAIQFGNLALLLGMMALCGWSAPTQPNIMWRGWLLFGFLNGLLASFLSGSRGGWLALILLIFLFLAYLAILGSWRSLLIITAISIATGFTTLQIPQLHIKDRISKVKEEVDDYSTKNIANSSIGARLQMWQFSWSLYRSKPLLGWSQRGYMEEKKLGIEAKRLDPAQAEFNHPHNDFLDAASKRGTIGLICLLLVYVTPFLIFLRTLNSTSNNQERATATAGMLIPIAYAIYGLTQSFLPHNSGIMVYTYMTFFIWATLNRSSKNSQTLNKQAIIEPSDQRLKIPTIQTAATPKHHSVPHD